MTKPKFVKRKRIIIAAVCIVLILIACSAAFAVSARNQPAEAAEAVADTVLPQSSFCAPAASLPSAQQTMTDAALTAVGSSKISSPVSETVFNRERITNLETEALAQSTATAVSEVQKSTGLHVSGTKLVDESGNTVQLRGVSTHGLAWFPQYVNQQLFTELHNDWNANVVRLAMYTAESGGYCSGGSQSDLKKLINDGVKYASNAGMYVIIDWHILSDGNPNTYKKEAVRFFSEMAETYADYDNVLYEICNEPNGGTSWSEIKSYAEDVIKAIRQYDDAVIIVGTPNWSQYVNDAAADPITDADNIMYSLHFYAATHKDSLRKTMTAAIDAGLPVFVTEYGICDASGNGALDTEEAQKWIDTMDARSVSYCCWSLCNKAESASLISPSCNKVSGFSYGDLSEAGKWIFTMLTGKKELAAPEASSPVRTDEPVKPTATQQPESTNAPIPSAELKSSVISDNGVSAVLTEVNTWENGGRTYTQYSCTVRNNTGSDSGGWEVSFEFPETVVLDNGWNGTFTVSGNTLTIDSMDYNGVISAGQMLDGIGFIVYTTG